MISVIIRTKNEAIWLERCLRAVRLQSLTIDAVILVDNDSVDGTPDIARAYDCTVLSISDREFTYGRALNYGIAHTKSEFIAILSAHCIPVNDSWLHRLWLNFQDNSISGVYGRQEPLPDSHDFDKRDLWTAFGLDRRVQQVGYFFHNANSMIRRGVWEYFRFDETLSGVEDRAWAKKVLAAGYRIVYEPTASVYHHHGIHQGRDETRAARVVKVIELLNQNQQPIGKEAQKEAR
jgi:glycosyltransferase involved in cell wall biosynthesis